MTFMHFDLLSFAILEQPWRDLPCQVLATGQDFSRRLTRQRKIRKFPGFGQFQTADDELKRRNQRGRGAEFIHTQAYQQWSQDWIACHFATHTDPDLVTACSLNRLLDELDDGRVCWLIK